MKYLLSILIFQICFAANIQYISNNDTITLSKIIFKKSDKNFIYFKKGEKFTVVGKVTGMDFGSVYIEDCQVKK